MNPSPALLQRCALGLWFLGLGIVGLLRWWMRCSRVVQAGSDPVMQAWLWGSMALVLLGAAWTIRVVATRERRGKL